MWLWEAFFYKKKEVEKPNILTIMDSSTHSEVLNIQSFSLGSLCGWISLPCCPVSELKALLPLQALPVRALLTPVGPPFPLLITRPSAVSTSSCKSSPQMGPFSGTAAVFGKSPQPAPVLLHHQFTPILPNHARTMIWPESLKLARLGAGWAALAHKFKAETLAVLRRGVS